MKASERLHKSLIKRRLLTALLWLPVLLVLLRLLLALCQSAPDTSGKLLVDVIDVGQSDAVLLRCEDTAMLIDSGTAMAGERLLFELRRLGVEDLDYLVLTHPHEDHYGNARRLLSELTVTTVLVTDSDEGDEGYGMLLAAMDERGISPITAETGQNFALGDAQVEVLTASGEDANNDSIVLRVSYGEAVLLFMGDGEAETEEALLARFDATYLDCDFLKVGHHGSKTATTAVFAAVTTPAVAAISCGADNEYGFPHGEVLQILDEVGAAVYRTDLAGTLAFEANGHVIEVRKDEGSWLK